MEAEVAVLAVEPEVASVVGLEVSGPGVALAAVFAVEPVVASVAAVLAVEPVVASVAAVLVVDVAEPLSSVDIPVLSAV